MYGISAVSYGRSLIQTRRSRRNSRDDESTFEVLCNFSPRGCFRVSFTLVKHFRIVKIDGHLPMQNVKT